MIEKWLIPTLGSRTLASIKPTDVQKLVARLQREGLAVSTIRSTVGVLSKALSAAVTDRRIVANPCVEVKLPVREQKEATFFEPVVVETIARAMPEPFDFLVRLLGQSGLRFGEAAALGRRHVDLLRRRLIVEQSLEEVSGQIVVGSTKNGKNRSVPLSEGMARALEEHLDSRVGADINAPLFTSLNGEARLRYQNFRNRLWVPVLDELGLPHAGIHTLRHSAAANMIAAGASAKTVQTVLGHSRAGFTLDRYGHLFPSELDELAAAMDASQARAESDIKAADEKTAAIG